MIILQIALFAMLLGTGAKESVRDIWIQARNAMDDLGQRAYLFLVENYLTGVKSCEAFDCPLDPKLGLTSWENLYSGMGFYFVNEMQNGQYFPLFPTDVMETIYDGTMCAVTVMSDIFCIVVFICLQVLLFMLIIITVEFLPILIVSVLLLPSFIPINKFKRRKCGIETKNVRLIINLETPKIEYTASFPQVPAERYFGIPAQPSPSEMRRPCTPQAPSSAGGMNAFTLTPYSVERKQDDVKQVLGDVIGNYNVKVDVDNVKCNVDSDGSNADHMDGTHGTMFHMYPHRPGRGRGRRGVLGMASRGSVIIRQPRNFVR